MILTEEYILEKGWMKIDPEGTHSKHFIKDYRDSTWNLNFLTSSIDDNRCITLKFKKKETEWMSWKEKNHNFWSKDFVLNIQDTETFDMFFKVFENR